MSRFIAIPEFRRLSDGRRELLTDMIYIDSAGREWRVPAGFVTDFSSVPGFARWIARWDRHDLAGVLHDYLYYCVVGRRVADAIYYEACRAGRPRCNVVQAFLLWAGVRLGGWSAWNEHWERAFKRVEVGDYVKIEGLKNQVKVTRLLPNESGLGKHAVVAMHEDFTTSIYPIGAVHG